MGDFTVALGHGHPLVQINSKNQVLDGKSVEDVATFECLPFNSSRRNCDVPLVLVERS
jgi:hypothetical protein